MPLPSPRRFAPETMPDVCAPAFRRCRSEVTVFDVEVPVRAPPPPQSSAAAPSPPAGAARGAAGAQGGLAAWENAFVHTPAPKNSREVRSEASSGAEQLKEWREMDWSERGAARVDELKRNPNCHMAKEKRKRDHGMADNASNFVEEEKRLLRHAGCVPPPLQVEPPPNSVKWVSPNNWQ
eukprot:Hpha_TRINITY_DN5282_c0_g1::TRINITY_DN5282_c0_g1_i2::g.116612::m.116612